MSSTLRRDTRHRETADDVRELHSFLTCRLTQQLPCSAREQGMTWRNDYCDRPHAYRKPETSGWRNGLPTDTVSGNLSALFAAPEKPRFEEGFLAELFALREIVFGSSPPAPGLLRHPHIADTAQRALLALDGVLCRIDAFVILPTHVHVLFMQRSGLRGGPVPAQVAEAFKATVLQEATRLLPRHGAFWERNDFHRYLTEEASLRDAVRFIRDAPVRGGLVETPFEWEWLYIRPALR
ncbi:MAG: hypothetical protein KFH87_11670 [Bacteroidetes bacterium]|nr:hypothetical protein [Bacteroidota bacterium]